jgi:hypothetical protein
MLVSIQPEIRRLIRLAGGDASHSFVTSPPSGSPAPTRIWAVGDSGTADANARAVRDAYYAIAGSTLTNLWLMLGDNAYQQGLDHEYQAAVFDTYPTTLRQTVLWPTLGNHDGAAANSSTRSGPYYDIFTLPSNGEAGGMGSGTEAYYSFDHGDIHFVCLDSFETNRALGSPNDELAGGRPGRDDAELGHRVLAPSTLQQGLV